MRKYLFLFLGLVLFSNIISAQNANDYFPPNPGHVWKFTTAPLDSLNNPITELSITTIDSFANIGNYFGRDSKLVLTKSGTANTVNLLPFLDSVFTSFNGASAYNYFSLASFLNISSIPDSALAALITSLIDWYEIYRFNQPANSNYLIFQKDTTVTIDSVNLPLRFEINGERKNDEFLSTSIGSFDTKKFIISLKISLLVTIPPFPPVPIKLIEVPTTNWIATSNWIVKVLRETVNVDLSLIGGPAFFIPGSITEIQDPVTSVREDNLLGEFYLAQNYPNPFNPSTTIEFFLTESGTVELSVFNLLGEKIFNIYSGYLSKGNYNFILDANNFSKSGEPLSSGVYFYRLQSDNISRVRKMILAK